MNRRITFAIASLVSLVASVFVASPALAADTTVASEVVYSPAAPIPYDNGAMEASSIALSDNGLRAVAARFQTDSDHCSTGLGKLQVRSGIVEANGQTTWKEPVAFDALASSPCGLIDYSRVFLAGDGLSGFVVWEGRDNNNNYIASSHFTVSADGLTIASDGTAMIASGERTFGSNYEVSADGQRLVAVWLRAAEYSAPKSFKYTVIDADSFPAFKVWTLPTPTYVGNNAYPAVALSSTGDRVLIGVTYDQSGTDEFVHNKMKFYSCTTFCGPTKLTSREVVPPAAQAVRWDLNLKMNDAGTRAVVSWDTPTEWGSVAPILVLNPANLAAASSAKIANVNNFNDINRILITPDGKKVVLVANNSDVGGNAAAVGTIGNDLKVTGLKTYSTQVSVDSVSIIYAANFVYGSNGVPTGIIISGQSNHGSTMMSMVSSSALTPTYWSATPSMFSEQTFNFGSLATSRKAARYAIAADPIDDTRLVRSAYLVGVVKKSLAMTKAPSLSGLPINGQKVTLKPGTWPGGTLPTSATWSHCDTQASPQPTGLAYTVGADADMGCYLNAVFTVTGAGYYPAQVSVWTTSEMRGKPITAVVTYSGATAANSTPAIGDVLAFDSSASTPSGTAAEAVWKIGRTTVGTGATYTVRPADAGKVIKLTVTVTKFGWKAMSVTKTYPAVFAAP